MAIEIFGLIKAVVWPVFLVWVVLKFEKEIRAILAEITPLLRRPLKLKAPGVEILLGNLENELPRAEDATKSLSLPMPSTSERQELPRE
jgi:hypothetical protein